MIIQSNDVWGGFVSCWDCCLAAPNIDRLGGIAHYFGVNMQKILSPGCNHNKSGITVFSCSLGGRNR